MPIKIPATLPAYDVLTREGVMVVDEELAARQDIRPLKIALLNLMPKKIQTENQFARLIGARHVVLPRSGHVPLMSQPLAFTRALGDFLADTE